MRFVNSLTTTVWVKVIQYKKQLRDEYKIRKSNKRILLESKP